MIVATELLGLDRRFIKKIRADRISLSSYIYIFFFMKLLELNRRFIEFAIFLVEIFEEFGIGWGRRVEILPIPDRGGL